MRFAGAIPGNGQNSMWWNHSTGQENANWLCVNCKKKWHTIRYKAANIF
jgi:hypothetical protein